MFASTRKLLAILQCQVGFLYYYPALFGAGDYREAFRWFRRAAQWGNASAQYGLAILYARGTGAVPSDEFHRLLA